MRQAKADLKDKRGGAYDTDTSDVPKKRAHETIGKHQQAQDGADVRTMPVEGEDGPPEGLIRERKGPLGPRSGRRGGNA
ncbi:MAG: hypothetical protein RO009_17880 [Pseudorhodoplanes sp.]|jgi:hypothetical protein|nr:hypothetical protein [Pseudorhodoplanes sp.]